eukprot:1887854-Rhodomonas_salina.1
MSQILACSSQPHHTLLLSDPSVSAAASFRTRAIYLLSSSTRELTSRVQHHNQRRCTIHFDHLLDFERSIRFDGLTMTALFLLLFGTIFPLHRDSLRGHNLTIRAQRWMCPTYFDHLTFSVRSVFVPCGFGGGWCSAFLVLF